MTTICRGNNDLNLWASVKPVCCEWENRFAKSRLEGEQWLAQQCRHSRLTVVGKECKGKKQKHPLLRTSQAGERKTMLSSQHEQQWDALSLTGENSIKVQEKKQVAKFKMCGLSKASILPTSLYNKRRRWRDPFIFRDIATSMKSSSPLKKVAHHFGLLCVFWSCVKSSRQHRKEL